MEKQLSKAINIDAFLLRDKRFWRNMEVHCCSECCGLDAFEFTEEIILSAAQFGNLKNIITNLEDLCAFMEGQKATRFSSREVLNTTRKQETFISIFEHIKNVLFGIKQQCGILVGTDQ
ncbi:DUF6331 family protein [Flavobacteriaceae bacterium M23B6Z8]